MLHSPGAVYPAGSSHSRAANAGTVRGEKEGLAAGIVQPDLLIRLDAMLPEQAKGDGVAI
jgi:hypothetical protein